MNDPKRLIVSEDNELGVALAAARRQLPGSQELARMAQRLADNGVNFPPGTLSPAASAPPRSSRFALKLKLGVGIAVVAGLGLFGASRATRTSAGATQIAEPVRNGGGSARLPSEVLAEAMASARASEPVRSRAASPEFVARAAQVVPNESASGTELAAPSVPVAVPVPVESHAAPRASSRARPAVETTQASSSGDVYAPPSGAELPTTELELVKQARNAVSADPARAYALTERSRAQFPNAVFAQERDFIALTALYRLGREQQARSLASSFRTRYPRSAYLPQIERMLGEP